MKLLLFDVDGTLLLTGGAGVRAMERAGQALFGPKFTMTGIVVSGGLDPLLYEVAASRAGVSEPSRHHEAFRSLYLELLVEELAASAPKIRVLPGVLQLLQRLRRDARVALGMVSGNYRMAAPLKLRAAGLDPEWFRWCGLGDEAPDRAGLVALAMARHREGTGISLRASDVIVIGDTPRDIACAQANGCRSLAVATGRYSRSQLLEAGAQVAVPDLKDAEPLFALLEAAAS